MSMTMTFWFLRRGGDGDGVGEELGREGWEGLEFKRRDEMREKLASKMERQGK